MSVTTVDETLSLLAPCDPALLRVLPACDECADDMLSTCERCESLGLTDDMREVMHVAPRTWRTTTAIWCDGCADRHAWTCDGCDGSHDESSSYSSSYSCCGGDYCEGCFETAYYCESCDESRCDSCGECDCAREGEHVHDGGYRPSPVWHRAPGELPLKRGGESYYFGIELELSGPGSMADALIAEHFAGDESDWFAKTDGSVRGLEFVSHPRTLASWQAFDLRAMLRVLRHAGAEGGRDGLHIHVSRAAMANGNMARRFVELLNNGQANRDLAEYVAGRGECSWAHWRDIAKPSAPDAAPRRDEHGYLIRQPHGTSRKALAGVRSGGTRDQHGDPIRSQGKGMIGGERYSVTNLCNRNTIEWRLGQSTLDAARILACVEYLAAAVEYVRGVSLQTEIWGALDAGAFIAWVADNMATYPHFAELLIPFIAQHGLSVG